MFLYFTKKDNNTGKIKAAYTGRFAFIADKLLYDEIDNTFKNITLTKNSIDNKKYEEIKEEFLHHIIFKKNISSLFINGFRYITRLIWRLFENKKIVNLYYQYRSLYFFIMYIPQEKIVEQLINKDINKINQKQIFKLLKYDFKYIKLLIKFTKNKKSDYVNLVILFLALPILLIIGLVITKFFTIILYEKNEKTNIYQHKYIAETGIVKDLNRKQTISSKIGEAIQFERIIQKINNFDEKLQNIKWMIIKFQSEKLVYTYILNHKNQLLKTNLISLSFFNDDSILNNFDYYVHQVVILAFEWADINPNKNNQLFRQFMIKLQQAIYQNSFDELKEIIENNSKLNRVVEFFYMHGN